jgi:hypothetical protein
VTVAGKWRGDRRKSRRRQKVDVAYSWRRLHGTNCAARRTQSVTIEDDTSNAVLGAFREARESGLNSAECYRAGVQAWRRRHPDHTPGYAAKQAVAVILAALGPELLKID